MEFKIQTNAQELSNWLSQAARKQLPFALSRAINDMAYKARSREQKQLDKYFDIRTPWVKKKGAMPVVKSDKRQFPDVHAILAVKDPIMALNATGGVKRAEGGDLSVPMTNVGMGISTRQTLNPSRQTLGPRFFPGRIVKKKPPASRRRGRKLKPKPFYGKTKSGDDAVFIRSQLGDRLNTLYIFKQRVRIEQNWPLIKNVEGYVRRTYQPTLNRRLREAIRPR